MKSPKKKAPIGRRPSKSAAQLDREITEALKSPTTREQDRQTAASLIRAQLDIVRGQLAALDVTTDQLLGRPEAVEVCECLTTAIRSLSDAVDAALTSNKF